jgi:hypothetical protein
MSKVKLSGGIKYKEVGSKEKGEGRVSMVDKFKKN